MAVSRKPVHLGIDVNFTCQEQKDSFCNRLSEVRKLLTQPGSRRIDNFNRLVTLFAQLSDSPSASTPSPHTTPPPFVTYATPFSYTTPPPPVTTQSFLPNSGELCWCGWKKWNELLRLYIDVYISLPSSKEGELFVPESRYFSALIDGLPSPCHSVARNPWIVESHTKVLYLFILVLLTQ